MKHGCQIVTVKPVKLMRLVSPSEVGVGLEGASPAQDQALEGTSGGCLVIQKHEEEKITDFFLERKLDTKKFEE